MTEEIIIPLTDEMLADFESRAEVANILAESDPVKAVMFYLGFEEEDEQA